MNLQLADQGFSFVPPDVEGNLKSRLVIYEQWMSDTGHVWWRPDLVAYRDWLFEADKSPVTVSAYLASVRGHYQALRRQRDLFFSMIPEHIPWVERKLLVDEIVRRIEDAIEPGVAPVRTPVTLTAPDGKHTWLSEEEADVLLTRLVNEPGLPFIVQLRNAAMTALAVTTGLRASELVSLEVRDLDQTWHDRLVVHVRCGKDAVERIVPYDDRMRGYIATHEWLDQMRIQTGRVFRSFYKGYKTLRPSMTVRAFQRLLARNPIEIGDTVDFIRPHDLRRTYARWCYYDGMDYNAIRLRLGHRKLDQTLAYIGLAMGDV